MEFVPENTITFRWDCEVIDVDATEIGERPRSAQADGAPGVTIKFADTGYRNSLCKTSLADLHYRTDRITQVVDRGVGLRITPMPTITIDPSLIAYVRTGPKEM